MASDQFINANEIDTDEKYKETNLVARPKIKTIYEHLDLYSKEQVDAVLEGLSEKDKNIIRARYGNDLDNPVAQKMTMEDSARFYSFLLPKIKKILANPVEQENLETIYDRFEAYSKEQLDAVLEMLSDKDRDVIKAIYGDNLDNPVSKNMNMKDRSRFYGYLVPKIETLLTNPIEQENLKTIYENFDSYSRKQVDAMLDKLSKRDKELIKAIYGDDLDNQVFRKLTIEEHSEFYNFLVPKMEKLLANPTGQRKAKMFYEFFDSYSREQVDAVLEKLPEKDRKIIRARYGSDLDNPVFKKMTKEETVEFYSKLVPKMRRLLSNPTGERKTKKIKTIYELLGSYSKEQIDTMLGNLSEEEKALVVARYGNDLDNPLSTKLVKEESIKFYNYLVPRMRKLLSKSNEKIESKTMPSEEIEILSNNQEFNIPVLTEEIPEDDLSSVNTKIMTRDDCIKTLQLIPGILKTMDICSSREIGLVSLVMSLKLGCIEGKCFSNSDISEILGIESREVIDITKKALLACKREISQFVDSTIEILDEEPDKKDNKVFYKVLPDNKNPKA